MLYLSYLVFLSFAFILIRSIRDVSGSSIPRNTTIPTPKNRDAPFINLDYGSFLGKQSSDRKIESFTGIPFVSVLRLLLFFIL